MIDKLELLLFLAQERHFGRAAEAAGVTQPTLSSGVKSLEEQLGVLIVERGSRFRGFTGEGERVLEWARRLVGDARNMRQEIDALKTLGLDPMEILVIPRIVARSAPEGKRGSATERAAPRRCAADAGRAQAGRDRRKARISCRRVPDR